MEAILIIEDEILIAQAIKMAIENYSLNYIVDIATDYDMALDYIRRNKIYKLFFIDIILNNETIGDESGYKLAKIIRKIPCYLMTPIVFITAINNKELKAYREIHCYQYLIKPFPSDRIVKIVKALEKASNPVSNWIIKKDSVYYSIDLKKLAYVEAIRRGVCLHLKNDVIEVMYLTLARVAEELKNDHFLQCHKSYIVNTRYIKYIDIQNKLITLNYNTIVNIDIGRTYMKSVREWLDGRRI